MKPRRTWNPKNHVLLKSKGSHQPPATTLTAGLGLAAMVRYKTSPSLAVAKVHGHHLTDEELIKLIEALLTSTTDHAAVEKQVQKSGHAVVGRHLQFDSMSDGS